MPETVSQEEQGWREAGGTIGDPLLAPLSPACDPVLYLVLGRSKTFPRTVVRSDSGGFLPFLV